MTAMSKEELAAMPVEFKLNGRDVVGHARRDHHPGRQAPRRRDPAPLLQGGPAARRQLPRLRGRGQGRARAGAVVLPLSGQGHGGHHRQRARAGLAEDGARAAALRHAEGAPHARTPSSTSGRRSSRSASRASRRGTSPGPTCRTRHRGEPRRLHPVHALPARLPRGAGERRHRLRLPRRALEDRVRPRRPDGRVHLRRLRRVRAGLPDRRADAGARRRHGEARQEGGLGVPVLRRRLPAHLPRQGQQDPLRRRARRPVQPRAAVREGPLRLRLRAPPAAPDQAADPQARRAQARGLHRRSRRTRSRTSARRAGKRRSTSPPAS